MEDFQKVDELSFGYELLTWESKGKNSLESVSIIEQREQSEIVYIPAVVEYVTFDTIVTSDGLASREAAMGYVEQCRQAALADIESRRKERNKG